MRAESLRETGLVAAGGIVALLCSFAYRYCMEASETLQNIVQREFSGNGLLSVFWFALLGLIAWQVWRIVRWNRALSGGGLAHVLAVYHDGIPTHWLKNVIGNITGGALSLFSGLSVGTESPIIQVGASGADGVAKKVGAAEELRLAIYAVGAGMGLGVGFSAPITGFCFTLWLFRRRALDCRFLFGAILSQLVAYGAIRSFYGTEPFFEFRPTRPIGVLEWGNLSAFLLIVPFLGIAFTQLVSHVQTQVERMPKKMEFWRFWALFMIAGGLAVLLPDSLGSGLLLISKVHLLNSAWVLIALISVKFVFSALCSGGGVPGGLMFPVLALGALAGKLFSEVPGAISLDGANAGCYIVCGMCALFVSVARLPLLGVLLLLEMTYALELFPAAALAAACAWGIPKILHVEGLFVTFTNRIVEKSRADETGHLPPLTRTLD